MKKSEIESLSKGPDLAGVRATLDECKELMEHQGFQAFEKLAINYLDTLYENIVRGGLDPLATEYLRGQIYAVRQLLALPAMNVETAETFAGDPVSVPQKDKEEMDDFVQRRYMDKGE